MTSHQQSNLEAVQTLFQAWREGGPGYDRFLAEDCLYETAGFPVLRGKETILDFLFRGGLAIVAARHANPALTSIRRLDAEVLHIAAVGSLVFTERIDHHYNRDGHEVMSPRMAGVMEFDGESRCIRWCDYHDPAYLTGRAAPLWESGAPTALAPSPREGD